jgi:hypothetical protein
MLNKIGIFTLFVTAGIVALLRSKTPTIDTLLGAIGVDVELPWLKITLGTALPALIVAILFRAVKMHDLLSDLFGIRRRFDLSSILMPLALGSGATLTPAQIKRMSKQRSDLMGTVFYKYASSTEDQSVIDRHAITMALDQWSWYWIVVEACAVMSVAALIFVSCGRRGWACLFLTIVLAAQWLLVALRSFCVGYALDEVKLILEDPARRDAIAGEFRAL